MRVLPGERVFSRTAGRLAVAVAVAVAAAPAGGCAAAKQLLFGTGVRSCDGFDAPLSSLAGSSRKELRVRVQSAGVDHDFPFVVEVDAESMVLVAFTPLGTKAFTLERRGDDVQVENLVGPALLVPPRNVMADLLAMSEPSACAGTPEASATTTVGQWKIADTCNDERPVRRAISRGDGPPEVEVEYSSDGIVVKQLECRYSARYVLQAAAFTPAPEAGDDDAGDGR